MKRFTLVMVLVAATATAGVPLSYEFTSIRGTVVRTRAGKEERIRAGAGGLAGDFVRTGWRGRVVVSSRRHAAMFEIFPSTHARLAASEPGVLILLERGKLKAIFDKITGDDPRLVRTPGATLAVRGTRYGVEVDEHGDASLAVFEGSVAVYPVDPRLKPAIVEAGEVCRYGVHTAPARMRMPGMSEHGWGRRGSMSGSMGDPGMRDGMRGGMRGQPRRGGHGH